jgi:putative selenate reductase FAD-binding subunit
VAGIGAKVLTGRGDRPVWAARKDVRPCQLAGQPGESRECDIGCAYRRPPSLEEAMAILGTCQNAVVLGGGTRLNADPAPSPVEVVDLQALRLDRIRATGNATVRIGRWRRSSRSRDSPVLPAVLREVARHERPSTVRRQATLGGCVAAKEAASDLLAALLAHEAMVSITGPGGTDEASLRSSSPTGDLIGPGSSPV